LEFNWIKISKFKNEIIEYPLINILNNQNKVWLTWISNNKNLNEGIIAIIDNLEGYCSFIMKKEIFRKY
jgi:hypothetical protein